MSQISVTVKPAASSNISSAGSAAPDEVMSRPIDLSLFKKPRPTTGFQQPLGQSRKVSFQGQKGSLQPFSQSTRGGSPPNKRFVQIFENGRRKASMAVPSRNTFLTHINSGKELSSTTADPYTTKEAAEAAANLSRNVTTAYSSTN